ncbi:hypothetical protein DERP_001411 [Dermatophagoides pteronyssinus]|uniref:Uncharacterized protein n=1 Tax=Dermatophagoides pteronyssinus TaxID=6956 RepID=A0ABQ8JF51_DERPT|nr:hypothetical protein DERP_001411 [Dermatophagoides pteronyssinus]
MQLTWLSWDDNYRVRLNDLFHGGNATKDLAIIVIIEISKNHGICKHSCNDINPSIASRTIDELAIG